MPLTDIRKILNKAQNEKKGVGAFNVGGIEMVSGIIKAAETMNTSVILQFTEGRDKFIPLELIGPVMLAAAKNAEVDVAVHLDHALSLQNITKALQIGFNSIMFDGSSFPLEENIAKTRKVRQITDDFGVALEGELGTVGRPEAEDTNENENKDVSVLYTDPDYVYEFHHKTNIDSLAIAIGNAHGHYKGKPDLRIDILDQSRVKANIPFVLHGGSGISHAEFQTLIEHGMTKINIATANFDAVLENIKSHAHELDRLGYFNLHTTSESAVCHNTMKFMKVFTMVDKFTEEGN